MRIVLFGLFAAALALGCGGDKIKPQDIEIKPAADPLVPVKSRLEAYVKGQPLGSEVTDFDQLVSDVRKTHPEKADILQKGLDDLKKARPNEVSRKAKDLLGKL